MAAAGTLDNFLTLLQKSRLLTEAAIRRCAEAGAQRSGDDRRASGRRAGGPRRAHQVPGKPLARGRRRGLFIDDYKIIELLGCGGMGYLYRRRS